MIKAKFWRTIQAQAGFTLPEVMIGAAILAGVALAGATLFKNQSTSQTRISADQQVMIYHAALTKVLENHHHCNATFKYKYNATEIGATDDLTLVRLCESNCNLDADAGSVTLATNPFITEADFINATDKRRYWRLTQLRPMNSLTKTGVLRLQATYTDIRGATREVKKDVLVNMRFDSVSNRFKECFNNQESSVNNLSKDLCDSMMASPTGLGGEGYLVYWDEADQKCKLNYVVKDCTADGMMVEGFASGLVTCRNIATGFNPTGIFDPNSDNCANNDKASVSWVNNKIKVTCGP